MEKNPIVDNIKKARIILCASNVLTGIIFLVVYNTLLHNVWLLVASVLLILSGIVAFFVFGRMINKYSKFGE